MISLRALRHFSALAKEGSYTRAALGLCLTQSALTRSIQSLESELGLKLLDRTPAGMELTKAGRAVLVRARRILAEANELERESSLIRGFDAGEVAFGAGVFPAAGFLSPLLTRLARDYPGIKTQVEIESWQRLLDMLEHDLIDFAVAITHSLPPSAEFCVRPLPAQHAGLFVRASHPLLSVPDKMLRNVLGDYRLVATRLPPGALKQLAKIYRVTRTEDLPLVLQCNSVDSLQTVALSSDVVLFCMEEAIQDELAEGTFLRLAVAYSSGAELTCSIVHRAHRTLSPATQTVIALIEDLMTQA
ncbi:LysR family transcriptional regulator [Pusillimonas sp. MFBS29]|uniref:LysR family transcriptional regulator n=1 Tax=Pusillimonas sp. MFBS29 TaxID=2886690 RepID=UPI001D10FD17|nr:LysR family transcriptional regulator [Pusillimonas sp. MFBS29]MCC2597102.1 LysR family transcriptional regulator [Pusillimonas sp. MFBS29]